MHARSKVATTEADEELPFYRNVLLTLSAANVQFLVGGAYAFSVYTGIERNTKDLDLFMRPADYRRAAEILAEAGYETELSYPHWLGKARFGSWFVDLIFNSGNGATPVDDVWFEHAARAEVLGVDAKIMPAEEIIWSKAFVMERERYDGADVAHLLKACAQSLRWTWLLERFGAHWRVLLSHLVLFGFIYPGERNRIPSSVMNVLLDRARDEPGSEPGISEVCRGTLLSREQYLHDVHVEGYIDGRLSPHGTMSADDIAQWTDAIEEDRTKL